MNAIDEVDFGAAIRGIEHDGYVALEASRESERPK